MSTGRNGIVLNDQGGNRMEVSEDVAATLRAENHGHPPCVMESAGFYTEHSAKSRTIGYEEECSPTLRAGVVPAAVALENHPTDSRVKLSEDGNVQTLTSRMGTGGNNVPLVGEQVYCLAGNTIDREPENGGNGIGYQENVAYTLTGFDRHAVFRRQRVDAFTTGEIAGTQSARQSKDATDLILHTCELMGDKDLPILLIRRLTPLECERLQGFPDGWTDIPGASDSARYKALGNSVAIPCVDFVMKCMADAIRGSD